MEHTAVSVQSYFRGRMIDARLVGRHRGCFRVGSSRRVDAPAAEALIGGAEYALLTVDGRGATLHPTPAMIGPGHVPEDGDTEVRCGAMTFQIGWAAVPAIAVMPVARRWPWTTQRYTLAVALATILVAGALALVPPERKALSLDMDGADRRYLAFRISAPVVRTTRAVRPARPAPAIRAPLPTIGPGGTRVPGPEVGRLDERLFPRRPDPIPDLAPGHLTTAGGLDREIVRRIIRTHLNEIRYCYELQLARHPTLGGRITLSFVVAPNGQVLSSMVEESTLQLPPLERCMTEATRRWTFPQPQGGGLTVVHYPFLLAPTGSH